MKPEERLAEIEKYIEGCEALYLRNEMRQDQVEDFVKLEQKYQGFDIKRYLLKRVKKLTESFNWIMPKVHQGNHDGEFETCMKATCVEYRKALESE